MYHCTIIRIYVIVGIWSNDRVVEKQENIYIYDEGRLYYLFTIIGLEEKQEIVHLTE